MPVTAVRTDPDALTLELTAAIAAPVETVWRMWADPRQLERWWGPPSHPATVVEHDLRPGGRVAYFMTGPDGERYHGWWEVTEADPPLALAFVDGFADETGAPDPELPVTRARVALAPAGDGSGTELRIVSRFASREQLDQLVGMGVVEGLTAAVNQMDAIAEATGR